jgi:hypothetical protein
VQKLVSGEREYALPFHILHEVQNVTAADAESLSRKTCPLQGSHRVAVHACLEAYILLPGRFLESGHMVC